jgi:hypothetical protein
VTAEFKEITVFVNECFAPFDMFLCISYSIFGLTSTGKTGSTLNGASRRTVSGFETFQESQVGPHFIPIFMCFLVYLLIK